MRALHAAGPRPRAALHVHRRAVRRPAPGREPRPGQGHRPLRAGPRHEVHELRRAHDPGRAEAALPRQGLVTARPARTPGAHARGEPRDRGAVEAELGRSPKVREVAEHLGCSVEQVLEAQEAAASYEAASLDARTSREDDESASLVDLLGAEDSRLRAGRETATPSQAPGARCPRSSARWSSCASCTTSRSGRSASGSATRRCTCHDCCGGRSTAWRRAAAAA